MKNKTNNHAPRHTHHPARVPRWRPEGPVGPMQVAARKLDAAFRQEAREEAAMVPARPPLGVMPRWMWDEQRIVELIGALERRQRVGGGLNEEWLEELRGLLNEGRQERGA